MLPLSRNGGSQTLPHGPVSASALFAPAVSCPAWLFGDSDACHPEPSAPPPRVTLQCDSVARRDAIASALTRAGYCVPGANDAQDRLWGIVRRPAVLAIIDLQAYAWSGLGELEILRREQPRIPVVYSATCTATRKDAYRLGATVVLVSPVTPSLLVRTAVTLLQARRSTTSIPVPGRPGESWPEQAPVSSERWL